jgi:hypothetical protein
MHIARFVAVKVMVCRVFVCVLLVGFFAASDAQLGAVLDHGLVVQHKI